MNTNLFKKITALALAGILAASTPAAVPADTGAGSKQTDKSADALSPGQDADCAADEIIDEETPPQASTEEESLVGNSATTFTLEQFAEMMDGFVFMEAEDEEIIFMGDDGWIYRIRNGAGTASPYEQDDYTYDETTGRYISSTGWCYQIEDGKITRVYYEDTPEYPYLPYETMTPEALTARLADEYVGEYNGTECRLTKTSDSTITLTKGNSTTVYDLTEWELFEADGCIMQKRYDDGYTIKYVVTDGAIREIYKETYFENEWTVYQTASSSETPVEVDLKAMMDGYAYMSADEYVICVGYDKRVRKSRNGSWSYIDESAAWTFDSATGIYRSDSGMCFRAENDKITEIFYEDDPDNVYSAYTIIKYNDLTPRFVDTYSGEYNGRKYTVYERSNSLVISNGTTSVEIDLYYGCRLFRTENSIIQVMDQAAFSVKYVLNGENISEIYLEKSTGREWDVFAEYYVTVGTAVGGTVTTDCRYAHAGDTVTVTATPNENYVLLSLTYNDNEIDLTGPDYSFIMPGEDVVIQSEFEASVIRSGICGDNLTWTLVQGVLTISGTGDMYDMTDQESSSIASTAPWNEYRGEIKKIVIGDGATSIGRCAFLGCSAVTQVEIPDSVIYLGRRCFQKCISLQEVTVPGSAEDMEEYIFAGCTSLTRAVIEEGVEILPVGMFDTNTSLTDVSLPESLTEIRSAFYKCTSLTNITIPDNVKILRSCFQDCSALESIVIPEGVTTLDGSFSRCTSLKSISIPNTVTRIEGYALDACRSLESITIPDSVTTIYDYAFRGCTGLKEIKIPEGVRTIEDCAFTGCTSLETIDIAATVKKIDKNAFIGCTAVTDVYIRGIDYGEYAFDDGSAVDDLNTPSGTVLHVPCCVVPASLTAEKDSAVYYWYVAENSSVVNDILGDTPHAVTVSPANGGLVTPDTATAPEGMLVTLTATANDGYELDQIKYNGHEILPVDGVYRFVMPDGDVTVTAAFAQHRGTCGTSAYWRLSDGVLTVYGSGSMAAYSKKSRAPWYDFRDEILSVTVERGVSSVGDYAFDGCAALESVHLPIRLSSIGEYAFSECSALTDIRFRDGADTTYINLGRYAFNKCTSLKNVDLSDYTRSITAYAFNGCTSLESVTFSNTSLIGTSAFSGCTSLQSITIPKGTSLIGSNAFYNCTNIKNVYIREMDVSGYSFDTEGVLNDFNTPTGTTIHIPSQVNPAALTEETGSAVYYWYRANRNSVVNDIGGRICYPIEIKQASGGTLTADKTTAEAGETVTLTAQPKNGKAPKTPSLNYTSVEVANAAENLYTFTMPQGDVVVTAGWGNAEPTFMTGTLNLSGRIGVNFYMDLPEIDGVDYSTSYMEFTVSGRDGKTERDAFDENQMNLAHTYYGFSCFVSATQMADTITAEYHYTQDGEEKTKQSSYSVEQYLYAAKGKFGDNMDALIQSLFDYGYHSQTYLSRENNWVIGTDHAAMLLLSPTAYTAEDKEAVRAALEDTEFTVDLRKTDIQKVNCSLRLDYDTSISLLFKPAEGYTGPLTAKLDGKKVSAKKQADGRYKVVIPNIGAPRLGQTYEVTVETESGTSTVTLSAMTYVLANLNLTTQYAERDNTMIALYRYYKAAEVCIG